MHWDTQRYLDRHGFIIERGQALADLLAPQAGERILDLGCGTGDIAAAMAERGAQVVGVDASPAMIANASERFPRHDFRVADAATLPFEAEFDAVFSHAVLHWVARAEDAARGIARALKPGGRFIAEFGGHRNCEALETAFADALKRIAGRDYRSPWTFPRLPDYTALLENQGLVVRAAWYFDLPTPLKGEDGLRQWFVQFLPHHLDGLDAATREAVLAATEAALKPAIWRDGAWWADYRRLRVAAEK
ncbi:class I SAM-dependent methyltransferase [Thiobacillus sp.]|uniref:class I SAM-dependent methyltransferase n=1 Tax=Thiobacillus sp. TaxID=924 RepID=UPI001AC1B154|nr:class I SAM-dependent methyltransferase [Thiobacillus sp.]MBN8779902.1 methyltransferase domain-containing protein [Thiobacillus sp.]